jgi:hypothetical protein
MMRASVHWLRCGAAIFVVAVVSACNSSTPSTPSTVEPPPVTNTTPDLSSVTLASSSVTAGQQVQGTVALTAAPSSGSITVTLSSSNSSIATVPSAAGVAQGSATSTFNVTALSAGTVTISATLGSTTRSSQLTVNAPPAGPVARFTVIQDAGTGSGDQCQVTRTDSGDLMNRMKCTFDGTGSTAPGGVTSYNWTLFNAAGQPAATKTGSSWDHPIVPCGFFDGTSPRAMQLTITPAGGTADKRDITITKANPC